MFWWLPVALIAAREIAISMYRSMAGRQGITIPARQGAKVKTVCQQFAVGFALLPWSADAPWLFNGFLWVAVVLTLFTGAQYLLDAAPSRSHTSRDVSLRCEVVAVGTELLLGQIVDTNSSWIGEQLALAGIDSHFQTKVGDNRARIVAVLRLALDRSDAVIVCGGLGPTHDDITRECIAEVMGVELERHDDIAERITQMFSSRGRRMAENNLRQADVPAGATVIPQVRGTAPGLVCPVGDKVIYAVPGVPHEMKEMVTRAILPDLRERSGETAVIVSRTLRTWGESESGLAEILAPADRSPRRDRQPDARVPRERHRGLEGAAHREGRVTTRPRRRCSPPKSRPCEPSSAHSCSASTTRRWRARCSRSSAAKVGRSHSRNR